MPTQTPPTACEPLEQRSLFNASAIPTYGVDENGTLHLNGTSGVDRMAIRSRSTGVLLFLNEDGSRRKRFVPGAIKDIKIDGGGGSDAVVLDHNSHYTTSTRRVERRIVRFADGRTAVDFATVAEPGRDETGTQHWLNRYQRQQKALGGVQAKTVFIGDSLTERLTTQGREQWKTLESEFKAADLGFSGDTTSSLLYRLNDNLLKGLWPRLIFLSIGTNNVTLTDSVASTVRGVRSVLTTLQAQRPQAKIVLSSILPRGADNRDDATADAVNAKLAKLAADFDVVFSDASEAFAPQKVKPREFDGGSVHLTRWGYSRWLPVITDGLKRAAASFASPARP
ncbi:MAG TPA: GDSL-type esterase/lipase family protein [Tepidisphaeraceae bacterium]|jgi:lysophospholipase L1-like esterase